MSRKFPHTSHRSSRRQRAVRRVVYHHCCEIYRRRTVISYNCLQIKQTSVVTYMYDDGAVCMCLVTGGGTGSGAAQTLVKTLPYAATAAAADRPWRVARFCAASTRDGRAANDDVNRHDDFPTFVVRVANWRRGVVVSRRCLH